MDKSSEFDGRVAKNFAKSEKRLQTQTRSHRFDAFDHIFVISFLSAIKLACDTNGIHERAVMWLFSTSSFGKLVRGRTQCAFISIDDVIVEYA